METTYQAPETRAANLAQTLRIAAGVTALALALAADFAVRPWFSAWQWMWLLTGTLFFGLKLLTLCRLDAETRNDLPPARALAYVFLWPGMRPQPFLRGAETTGLPVTPLAVRGGLNFLLGVTLLWLVPDTFRNGLPTWAQAWLGLIGIALVVHFGLFDLLAAAWRSVNVPVEPIFVQPTHAASVSEYWGRRWNRAFSDFSRDLILKPLSRRFSPRLAAFAVFVFSGLVHDLVISVPAGGGYGLPTLYFLLQGVFVLGESSLIGRRLLRRRPALGHIWTWVAILAPAPLLFHAPFLDRVVLPFLHAIGAGGTS